jgi:hypothetical protein
MIRDIINEYSINLEYIVANVTELDDGNFETVLVLFDGIFINNIADHSEVLLANFYNKLFLYDFIKKRR